MVNINTMILIITLKFSDLNTPGKRQRLSEQIKKKTMCHLQETDFKYKDTYRLEVK